MQRPKIYVSKKKPRDSRNCDVTLSALNGAPTICECDVTAESILSPAAEPVIGRRYHVLARAHVFASSEVRC
ncbi:unnamed protein product [Larinioides sclopetarius]|uniref:Uncharacterized protein n=1 Tax=Larinioides sclopetarius TaxID=280406 RepID=A0AAV2APC9_9ARAC